MALNHGSGTLGVINIPQVSRPHRWAFKQIRKLPYVDSKQDNSRSIILSWNMAVLPVYTAAGRSDLMVGLASAYNQNSIPDDIERLPPPAYSPKSRLSSASRPAHVSDTPDETRDGRLSRNPSNAVTSPWRTLPTVLGPLFLLWLAFGVVLPATRGEFCRSTSGIAVYWILGVLSIPIWVLIHLSIVRVQVPDGPRRLRSLDLCGLLLGAVLLQSYSSPS